MGIARSIQEVYLHHLGKLGNCVKYTFALFPINTNIYENVCLPVCLFDYLYTFFGHFETDWYTL